MAHEGKNFKIQINGENFNNPRYEMSNCLFEAAFENILERCRCAPGRKRLAMTTI